MGTYTEEQQRAGQRVMVLEGTFARAMEGFTGGIVMAAFALRLGATDLQIGVIASIPFLAQLAHVPAIGLLSRWPDRKPLSVYALAAARTLLIPMGLLPFLNLPRVPALVTLLILYAILATFSGAAWQVWMRDLVPRESLGSYHGRRFGILAIVGLVILLVAGQFVARAGPLLPQPPLGAYTVLFVVGGGLGLVSCAIMARAPSVPTSQRMDAHLTRTLRRPLRERNWRRVLLFLGVWGFAANLALPFMGVVLLRTLGYGLGVVAALAATSLAANFLGFRLWAPLIDRFGAKPVLGLTGSVFVVSMLGWAILPNRPGSDILAGAAVVHVLLGLATSGLDLASTTLTMKLAPADDAAAYLSTASVAKAVATGIAPLLAGLAATFLADRSATLSLTLSEPSDVDVFTVISFAKHDFLFLASAILSVYALHRLLAFTEPGEAAPETVVRAMRRDVTAVSSVAGMRQFAHIASYVVEAALRVERKMEVLPDRTRRRPPDPE